MTILDPHLDREALSAALDGDDGPGARAHLETCPACRERLGSWTAVVASLRSTAGTDRLPAGDAERIVATALAWAAPASAPAGAGDPAAATPSSWRRRSRPTQWRKLALTAGAGIAAAGVVALAVVGLEHLGSGASVSSSAASSGAASQPASGANKSSSSSSGGSGSASAGGASDLRRPAALPAQLGAVADAGGLERQLRSILGSSPVTRAVPSAGAAGGSGSGGGAAGAVPACRTQASRSAVLPAADLFGGATVRFAGKPAEVYVYADGRTWEAWVLSRRCAPVTELRF